MVHAMLLVEGSNGLRTRQLAARGMHGLVGKIVIDVAENGFDQIAAVIDFGDDAIRTVCRIALNHPLRCIVGAELATEIVDHNFAYKAVHASRGKLTRAEPIAALYEQHRVHHMGAFGVLEDQMCDYVPQLSKSPDRMDALVWALTELSGDYELEIILEYSEQVSISPELDEFDRILGNRGWSTEFWDM